MRPPAHHHLIGVGGSGGQLSDTVWKFHFEVGNWKWREMMKALETHYNGYKFRSRLEARWAVFFDQCGIEYDYEVQGFITSKGPYLPDFYLPNLHGGLWIEIKPIHEDGEAEDKLSDVAAITEKAGLLLSGDPLDNVNAYHCGKGTNSIIFSTGSDYPYLFCVCPVCNKVGIEFDGRGARVCNNDKCNNDDFIDPENFSHLTHPDKAYSPRHPILLNAAEYARKARFEFGEKP